MGELADDQILKFVGRNQAHFLIHHFWKFSSEFKVEFSDFHSIDFLERVTTTDDTEFIVGLLPDGIEGKVDFLKSVDPCKFPRVGLDILDLVEGKSDNSESRRQIVDNLKLIMVGKDLLDVVVVGIVEEGQIFETVMSNW